MEKIKKIFTEENMSWKKLIIYSVICGVITGIIPLIKILDETSIHNIAVCFEMWVLLAMYVILKTKKPLEAGIKTFVFFLISQPLCYLVQVPFYINGFGIFIFYPYWFKLTLLTFPGAIIAWYTKKENVLSMVILSIANLILSFELCTHFEEMISSFPYQLLAVLFIVFEIIFLINVIFKLRKKRIILYVASIFLIVIAATILKINEESQIKNPYSISYYELETNDYTIIEKSDDIEVEIKDSFLRVQGKTEGTFIIKIKDSNDQILEFTYVFKNGNGELERVENGLGDVH